MFLPEPTTRRTQLHDTLGRILNGDNLTMQAPMEAYTLIFELLNDEGPPSYYVEVYDFVRDSLAEHIQTKINKAENVYELMNIELSDKSLGFIQAAFSYLRRPPYIARTNPEDIVTFARRTFLEAKHEKVLASTHWLAEWLACAIDGVEDGRELTDDTKRAGQLFLDAYSQHQDDYEANFALPFIRAAVAHFHEKAKELVAEDDPAAYQQKKHDILRLESARGEAYLYDSQRRDYLDTLGELFDLGDQKFHR